MNVSSLVKVLLDNPSVKDVLISLIFPAFAACSGGASAVKEPGHFEVRKSSSQVTLSQGRIQDTLGVHFSLKKLTTFLTVAIKTQAANAAD